MNLTSLANTLDSCVARGARAACGALACALVSIALPAAAQFNVVVPTIIPAAPTTADNVVLRMPGRCAAAYMAPLYNVRMTGTNILVQQRYAYPAPPCPAPPFPESQFAVVADLGRLPAGTYTVNVIGVTKIGDSTFDSVEALDIPLTVVAKPGAATGPAPFINYAGHWWDQTDVGAGFMIYQGPRDDVLVAWFTYALDGKPEWYALQGGRWVSPTRYEGPLYRTSRAPNPNAPGSVGTPLLTAAVAVGNGAIDFSGADGIDSGVFIATLPGGGLTTRNIRRFGK